MEFPNLVELFRIEGDKGVKIMDKETAEYVTSKYIYFQVFMLERRAIIEKVTLAMHKFGGDGTIYIDLVKDDNGKPGLISYRSKPVFVGNIKKQTRLLLGKFLYFLRMLS